MEQDCDLLGGFNGDGNQCAIGVEELVDLIGHGCIVIDGKTGGCSKNLKDILDSASGIQKEDWL